MTKKQRVLAVLRGEKPDHTPAGFSLHFPAEQSQGEAGVRAHLEFFQETGTRSGDNPEAGRLGLHCPYPPGDALH